MDGEGSLARESHGEGSGIGVNGTRRAPNQSHPLSVDGVSMKTTNAHALQMAQQDNENTAIDINELKRRIERRDAENKRKDREIILLQKEILNLTKNVQELRERNEQLHNSLSNTKLLAISTRNEQENQLTNSLIQDLQTKLSKLEKSYDELLHDNEMYKANSSTLNEKILSNATSLEIRTQEVVSLKEENYSLNIKLKTLQIRLQEKDAEMEKLQVLNENLIKSERQLKHQLEHEKTVIYEHERTINDLLATNKRVMAANLIKNETNQFLKSELNVIRDGEGHGNEGGGVGGGSGGHLLSSTDLQLMKEVEKANHQLKERNKELQNSIELHMDLLQRCEQENGVLKLKLQEETNLREELQHEMKNNLENGNNKEMTYQQIKKEIVKLRKENKILSEKCDELMRSGGGNKGSGPGGHGRQNVNGGGGLDQDQSFATRNGPSNGGGGNRSAMTGDERKKLKLLDETVKALRNRISFLLEQLSHLSQQSTAWNEQKLILKSQISSLLEANISLRERLLTVQRSFMERSLYEMDHPAVRRNAKAIFLTENEEERVMTTGQLNQMDGNEEYHQQFTTPEEVIEGAIVSHSLVPMPLKGLSQDPKAREARLLEYSMRSELGQPIPFTVEGFIERTLFDTLCAFTSGVRQASEAGNKSKHVMKPKIQKSFYSSVGTDGLYSILLEQGQYSHITTQADMSIRAEAEELLTGLQIPAFLKFVQTRPPEKFVSLFTEKLAAILNFLRNTIHDYVNQLGESRIANAKLQSKISHCDLQVHFMKQQFSSERLSKQKNIMKYIREQLQLSDYKKLIYDISALGRDSLDEIDVQRRDLTDELKRENPSYYQMVNATHAEKYHGLESQKLRGLMVQLRSVAEKLSTTALHHFGDDRRGERDEIVGSIEIKLYDSQIDDETCHGVVGLLSGALSSTSGEGQEGEHDENGNGDIMQSISRGDKVLANELGISNSVEMLSTASILAKSFLKIQSNYIDRLLLINLKDNCLTDISCKVLCSVVEKSSSLRMLDVRGNLISSNGAKMLFDATRRNPTVLYVTQRQNGLMVEGHREIMGAQGEKKSNRDSSLKSGIVGTRATENREFDENEDSKQILEHAAEQETALLRKYPLRIDIRDNNPEQVVAERLLEATEYTLATTKSVKNTSVSEMVEDVDVYDAPEPQRLSQSTRAAPVSGFASRQRPLSASNVSTAHRAPPRPHHQITLPTRPSSSNGLPTRGVSGAGILNISSKSAKKFDDDSEVDEDEDEAEILGQPEDENEQNSFLRKKLEEKKIERLEGVNGGGVGSLLDTAIRKMQIQSGEVLSGSINPAATSNSNVITKKLKRKVVVSNGLVKRSQPPGVAPIPGAGKKNLALTIHQKKQEMKGVYVNPVIRPISKPAGNPPAGGKSNLESKGGFVEKKRVGISSANSQKLSLSKSAPVIQRPQSAPSKALKSAATLGVVAGSLGPSGGGVGGGGHASNPYTQRALNPGILF